MAKLERTSIKINTFTLTENGQGFLTIPSINVSGVDSDTNDSVQIISLTPEQEAILAEEVSQVIKKIVRFQQMSEE